MNAEKLKALIHSLEGDIEFEYDKVHGAICPFSRSNISVGYGNIEVRCSSVDEVMELNIFNGKKLKDVCDKLDIY